MDAGKTHEVTILVRGPLCAIEPGDLFVERGDRIVFVNATKKGVTLLFGNPALFKRKLIEISAGGTSRPLTVGSIRPPRLFEYAVYSERTGAFGVGGSNPRIIIME